MSYVILLNDTYHVVTWYQHIAWNWLLNWDSYKRKMGGKSNICIWIFKGKGIIPLGIFRINRSDKLEIIQVGKTRNGFPLGQFMIRVSLIRVETGKSLGIVYKIRIPRKIIDNISNQHLLTLRTILTDMAFWNFKINKNNHRSHRNVHWGWLNFFVINIYDTPPIH